MNTITSTKIIRFISAFATALILVSSLNAAPWMIIDDFELGTENWDKTTGTSYEGLGNTSTYGAASDPLRPNNQVMAYSDGNGKAVFQTLGDNSVPVGGTATFYFEWYAPMGMNYNVSVGMSHEDRPELIAGDTPDWSLLAFRAAGNDDNGNVHFKVNNDSRNRGTWHVTTTPFTENTWWSYWMVFENDGGVDNSVTFYASPLGDSPNLLWTDNYRPDTSDSIDSVLMIGGGNNENTDTTYYDNFAIADGVNLSVPVPEPSSYALIAGLIGLGLVGTNRRFISK